MRSKKVVLAEQERIFFCNILGGRSVLLYTVELRWQFEPTGIIGLEDSVELPAATIDQTPEMLSLVVVSSSFDL